MRMPNTPVSIGGNQMRLRHGYLRRSSASTSRTSEPFFCLFLGFSPSPMIPPLAQHHRSDYDDC